MIRLTGFVHLAGGAPEAVRDELIGGLREAAHELDLLQLQVSPTAPPAHRAGHVMVLAAFADLAAYEAAREHAYTTGVLRPLLERHAAHVEVVRYRQGPVIVQDPKLVGGIQRTLLVHVPSSADPAAVAAFERQLGDMTRYIDTIRNSSVSRVDEVWGPTGLPWTHVWEQEFETLDGLTGPYMDHAYHWALVDTWFDPQQPHQIVDTTLVHAMCELDRSILACAKETRERS